MGNRRPEPVCTHVYMYHMWYHHNPLCTRAVSDTLAMGPLSACHGTALRLPRAQARRPPTLHTHTDNYGVAQPGAIVPPQAQCSPPAPVMQVQGTEQTHMQRTCKRRCC